MEYACNNLPPSWPHGFDCEIFSIEALKECHEKAVNAHDREHVTPWIRRNCSSVNLINPKGNEYGLRITLDTIEDYLFIKEIYDTAPNAIHIDHTYLEQKKLIISK